MCFFYYVYYFIILKGIEYIEQLVCLIKEKIYKFV